MSRYDEYGFLASPANGLGIIRARTLLGNLRLWEIPRGEQALDIVVDEIGRSPIPGLYMLFDERNVKKVYIGETEDIKGRLITHFKIPQDKIRNWETAIIINDGRNATQSDFNDKNIRLVLENYLVKLLKLNRFQVVTSSSSTPGMNPTQKTLCDSFKEEIGVLLSKMNKITRFITERADEEVYLDEAKKILERKGWSIQKWGALYASVNNEPTIIRPGSPKQKGWQVTFRGSKSLAGLSSGSGYLLMPRGKVLLIPMDSIQRLVLSVDKEALNRDTVDIFIRFDEDRIILFYKNREIDITAHSVQPYP